MWIWLAPLFGAIGAVAYRSWLQDAAIRSGELMDVRDVLPEGAASLEVRVLANRRYRVELQCEFRLAEASLEDPDGQLPVHLVVSHADGNADGAPVYDRQRTLSELMPFAWGTRECPGDAALPGPHTVAWGSLPLLELTADALVRLRFELSLPASIRRGGTCLAQVAKASLVVKEDVRPMRGTSGLLDRIEIDCDDGF